MATETTFTVPSGQFPLGTVSERLPDVTDELERIVPAGDVIIPYFWVRGTVVDDIESVLGDHPGVPGIRFVDAAGGEYLLRIEWTVDYDDVLTVLTEMSVRSV